MHPVNMMRLFFIIVFLIESFCIDAQVFTRRVYSDKTKHRLVATEKFDSHGRVTERNTFFDHTDPLLLRGYSPGIITTTYVGDRIETITNKDTSRNSHAFVENYWYDSSARPGYHTRLCYYAGKIDTILYTAQREFDQGLECRSWMIIQSRAETLWVERTDTVPGKKIYVDSFFLTVSKSPMYTEVFNEQGLMVSKNLSPRNVVYYTYDKRGRERSSEQREPGQSAYYDDNGGVATTTKYRGRTKIVKVYELVRASFARKLKTIRKEKRDKHGQLTYKKSKVYQPKAKGYRRLDTYFLLTVKYRGKGKPLYIRDIKHYENYGHPPNHQVIELVYEY